MNKKILLASAVTIALLAATPALADEGKRDADRGLHLGGIVKALVRDAHSTTTASTTKFGKIVSELAHKLKDDRDHNRGKKDEHAATTTVSVTGTVFAINGTTITLTGKNGAAYTIQAGGAEIVNDGTLNLSVSDIRVGDTLTVKGPLSGGVVTATHITDKTAVQRAVLQRLNNIRVGVVSVVSGSEVTLDRFGTGTTSVTTNASTTFRINGQATTSSALAEGQLVIVAGQGSTVNGTDAITASVIYIIDRGLGFLKHLFF